MQGESINNNLLYILYLNIIFSFFPHSRIFFFGFENFNFLISISDLNLLPPTTEFLSNRLSIYAVFRSVPFIDVTPIWNSGLVSLHDSIFWIFQISIFQISDFLKFSDFECSDFGFLEFLIFQFFRFSEFLFCWKFWFFRIFCYSHWSPLVPCHTSCVFTEILA